MLVAYYYYILIIMTLVEQYYNHKHPKMQNFSSELQTSFWVLGTLYFATRKCTLKIYKHTQKYMHNSTAALTDTSRVMLILKNAEKVTLHGFVCCFVRIVFFYKKNAKMIFS